MLIGLEVYHRTYAWVGREHLDDLEALCTECHAKEPR